MKCPQTCRKQSRHQVHLLQAQFCALRGKGGTVGAEALGGLPAGVFVALGPRGIGQHPLHTGPPSCPPRCPSGERRAKPPMAADRFCLPEQAVRAAGRFPAASGPGVR